MKKEIIYKAGDDCPWCAAKLIKKSRTGFDFLACSAVDCQFTWRRSLPETKYIRCAFCGRQPDAGGKYVRCIYYICLCNPVIKKEDWNAHMMAACNSEKAIAAKNVLRFRAKRRGRK